MARSVATLVQNNFSKGRVTEVSPLAFPENAVLDDLNCVFDEKGKVERRKGFEYEEDNELFSTEFTVNQIVSEYFWKSVAGLGTLSFVVLQKGPNIFFYEVNNNTSLSGGRKSFFIDLKDFMSPGAPFPDEELAQYSVGNGVLFVTHPYCDSFTVEYDVDTDNIITEKINIQIRDFKGVEDGLEVDARPSTLSSLHHYNLRNQGWYAIATTTSSASGESVLNRWFSSRSDYPSNADVWWKFKNSNEEFDPTWITKFELTNTPAPKGHFILDAFYQDRSMASGVSNIPIVSSSYFRPSTTAFFAGRVFYAGVGYKGFNNRIYFSKILEDKKDAGKCYQQNDPTSSELFDLLPTDGGDLLIPDAATIVKLFAVRNYLIVFCTNGIWIITGASDNAPFTANDFSVSRLSTVSALTAHSFVDVDSNPVWWNEDGIWIVSRDPQYGTILPPQSLTDETIKTDYSNIPILNKRYAKGSYNPVNKIIQWLFREDATLTIADRVNYNRILNLSTKAGAFYFWDIPETGPRIAGIISVEGQGFRTELEPVLTTLGELVTDSFGEPITSSIRSDISLNSVFKYVTFSSLTTGMVDITFSEERNTGLLDWITAVPGGVRYDSYFLTGYSVYGEAQRDFQSNYITIYCEENPLGSGYVQGVWDFANDRNSNRYSVKQQFYKHTTLRDYNGRRLKIRGHGKALQLLFTNDGNAPFKIVGWSLLITGNSSP